MFKFSFAIFTHFNIINIFIISISAENHTQIIVQGGGLEPPY